MDYKSYTKQHVGILVPQFTKGTHSQSEALQTAVLELLEEQASQSSAPPLLLINLEQLSFIDSNFLGALVKCLKITIKKNGELALCSLQAPVKSMFELTRLYNIFKIYNTESEALNSLSKV